MNTREFIKEKTPLAYFIIVFLVAWPIWILSGLYLPEYFLIATLVGAWSPTLTALYIIWLKHGSKGLKRFLKSLINFKVGWYWYGMVLFSIPLIAFLSIEFYELVTGTVHTINRPNEIPESIPLFFVVLIGFFSGIFFGGPLAEDIGWRGFIVPELHKRNPALSAALIVGVIWVIWHLPFYWFDEGLVVIGNVPLPWFSALTMAWAVLFAWVYFNTDSLIMPVFYHSSINTTLGLFGVLNKSTGEADWVLLFIHTLLTWIFTIWVIWYYGPDTLVKDGKFDWEY